MTELNKINFMSKSRFDSLVSINPDELYAVKVESTNTPADKYWVVNYFSDMLDSIYPVGSIYIGTMAQCPIALLLQGSVWEKVSEGRVLEGSDSSHATGTTAEAGLPNITGTYYQGNPAAGGFAGIQSSSDISGALYDTNGKSGGKYSAPSGDTVHGIGFDASLSNSIYGNSDTVQPPAYFVNIWKRTA